MFYGAYVLGDGEEMMEQEEWRERKRKGRKWRRRRRKAGRGGGDEGAGIIYSGAFVVHDCQYLAGKIDS